MQAFTILILEDEPYIASELAENAAENGYHVVVAHTAQQALDMVKKQPIHLALLDIRMEGESIDGIDVAQAIRKSYNIPIIFLTAYANDPKIRARAEAIHPAGFLEKGAFDLEDQLNEKLEEGIDAFRQQEQEDGAFDKTIFGSDGRIIINTDVDVKDLETGRRSGKKRRILLHVDEISYITKVADRSKLVTDKGVFEISAALTWFKEQIEQYLPLEEHNKLCLAHQSSIVNPNKIVAYDKIGGTNYVYFNVEDSDEEGVPVKGLFIQYLEKRYGKIKAKPDKNQP